tara:strand:- start:1345 stop:1923 length:579 start_codon:yes stop_codon:yes gene_type:complete
MSQLKEKIDKDLGFYYWKYYIAGAFWSNIATPINLTITILSALVSGQANTDSLLSVKLYKNLSIALLLLSTVNTFLRPHIQMNENVQMKKKYDALGSEFEKIVFSNISENQKIKNYELIAEKIDQLRINDTPVSQNYLTDLIHIICRNTCLIEKNLWLNLLYKNSHNNESVNLDNIDCSVNEFRSYNEDNEC